jgi:Tfp pilus assembly protein, pilus retraction ATPase PilT
MSIALTVSETKHMLSGTLHPTSAAQTIERIIDIFRQINRNRSKYNFPRF